MSNRCWTVAPSSKVPCSSGTNSVTRAEASRRPRPTSTPTTVEVTDLDTDINRCGTPGAADMAPPNPSRPSLAITTACPVEVCLSADRLERGTVDGVLSALVWQDAGVVHA